MIRVGIAGLGFMGMTHYHAIKRLKGVRVDAIGTRDPKKLAGDWTSIQGNFGPRGGQEDLRRVRAYERLEELLADPELDLIDITLPTARHLDVTLAALKAGKHVLVEKPIALKLEEGRRMTAAAKKAGRKLFVAHVLPFFPDYAEARRIAASGKHGKLLGAHFKRIISKPDWSAEARDHSRSGGPAIDLHIHDTHFIQLLFGVPKAVYARGIQAQGAMQYLATNYLFADSNLAVSCASGSLSQRGRSFTHGFEIYLERGTLLYEWATLGGKPHAVMPLTLLTPDGKAAPVKTKGAGPEDAFAEEIRHCVEALQGKHEGELLSADGALAALTLCYREIESAKTGKPVKV
ncbi:MAG: Gfo/Idh/MocA family oxidoreductase [Planctomycetota bacterium]|nr:Gfo/Idh/MocA family oxidoreductase [Planctomycetota bacterium]